MFPRSEMLRQSETKASEESKAADVVIADIDRCSFTLYPQNNPKFTELMLSEVLVDHIREIKPRLLVLMTHRTSSYIPFHQEEIFKSCKIADRNHRITRRNLDNTFTSRFVTNFAKAVDYKGKIIVSTRGDRGHHCGYDFEQHMKPYEEEVIKDKNDSGEYFFPEIKATGALHPAFGKNTQLQQILQELPTLCPESKSFNVHCFDDMKHICLLTAHYPTPPHISLKSYHHCTNDKERRITTVPRLFQIPEHKNDYFTTQAKTIVESICKQNGIGSIPKAIVNELRQFLEANLVYLPNNLLWALFTIDDSKHWYFFGKKILLLDMSNNAIVNFQKYLDEVTLFHLPEMGRKTKVVSRSDEILNAFSFNLA